MLLTFDLASPDATAPPVCQPVLRQATPRRVECRAWAARKAWEAVVKALLCRLGAAWPL